MRRGFHTGDTETTAGGSEGARSNVIHKPERQAPVAQCARRRTVVVRRNVRHHGWWKVLAGCAKSASGFG
jgi:hypothetical protein